MGSAIARALWKNRGIRMFSGENGSWGERRRLSPQLPFSPENIRMPLFFQSALAIALPIVGEQYAFALVDGLQVDGAAPHHMHILEGLLGVDQVEFLSLEHMLDIEF